MTEHLFPNTIEVSAGITLRIESSADAHLVERIQALLDRDANLDSIKVDVETLVEADRLSSLEYVLEATGYINNRNSATSEELGTAIMALLGAITFDRLLQVAQVAAFEGARTLGKRLNEDEVSTEATASPIDHSRSSTHRARASVG